MPAGTYAGHVDLVFDEKKATCSFKAPKVTSPQTIHILLEAYDIAVVRTNIRKVPLWPVLAIEYLAGKRK